MFIIFIVVNWLMEITSIKKLSYRTRLPKKFQKMIRMIQAPIVIIYSTFQTPHNLNNNLNNIKNQEL